MTFSLNDQSTTPTPHLPTHPSEHIPNSRYQAWAEWLHSAGRTPEAEYVGAFAAIEKALPPPPRAGKGEGEGIGPDIVKRIRTLIWEANFSARYKREADGDLEKAKRWEPEERKYLEDE